MPKQPRKPSKAQSSTGTEADGSEDPSLASTDMCTVSGTSGRSRAQTKKDACRSCQDWSTEAGKAYWRDCENPDSELEFCARVRRTRKGLTKSCQTCQGRSQGRRRDFSFQCLDPDADNCGYEWDSKPACQSCRASSKRSDQTQSRPCQNPDPSVISCRIPASTSSARSIVEGSETSEDPGLEGTFHDVGEILKETDAEGRLPM